MTEIAPEFKRETIHHVLARSYFAYLLGIVGGVLLNSLVPLPYHLDHGRTIGLVGMMLGTLVILWAQGTSRRSRSARSAPSEDEAFMALKRGPYRFFRSPTHIGLFLLSLSLGMMLYSFWMVLIACGLFLFTRYTFVKKEEGMLLERYGNAYARYKKSVCI